MVAATSLIFLLSLLLHTTSSSPLEIVSREETETSQIADQETDQITDQEAADQIANQEADQEISADVEEVEHVVTTTAEGVSEMAAGNGSAVTDELTSRSSRSNMYGNEVDRLIEAHEWENLDLQLVWDEHARQLAAVTLESVNDGECLKRQRCFTKVKPDICNDYNQSNSFKCYSVAIEETPYVARQLSTDYLSRTSKILMNNFSRNTKYGCAVSAIRATAKVNCVYVVPKRRISA